MARIRRVIDSLEAKIIGALSVEAVEDCLRTMAEDDNLGNRTYNHYVQVLDEFTRWLVEKKRISSKALRALKRLNTEVAVRHRRRALSPEEIGKLSNRLAIAARKFSDSMGRAEPGFTSSRT
jgi:hypothetical protein